MGPLPQPSYMRDVTVERHGGPLPYYRRPVLLQEYLDIDQMIFDRELPQALVSSTTAAPTDKEEGNW